MMSDDPNAPRNLISASNEIEAAAIVNALLLDGIEAYATAADPIGIDVAQAPSCVNILV